MPKVILIFYERACHFVNYFMMRLNVILIFQQALLSLAPQLVVSLLVADAICAKDNDAFKVRLLSSTNLMNGVTTLAMVLFGTRCLAFIHMSLAMQNQHEKPFLRGILRLITKSAICVRDKCQAASLKLVKKWENKCTSSFKLRYIH